MGQHVESIDNLVLARADGSDEFPVEWAAGERELLWLLDDLHLPEPVSPLGLDVAGWWVGCGPVFRRAGVTFAADLLAKNVNGRVYTAAVPPDPELRVDTVRDGVRAVAGVPRPGSPSSWRRGYVRGVGGAFVRTFPERWAAWLRPELEANLAWLDRRAATGVLEHAVLLEDALEIHRRHWRTRWTAELARLAASAFATRLLGELDVPLEARLLAPLQRGAAMGAAAAEGLCRLAEALEAGDDPAGLADASGRPYDLVAPTWCERPDETIAAAQRLGDRHRRFAAAREDADAARETLLAELGEATPALRGPLDLVLRTAAAAGEAQLLVDLGTNARLRRVVAALGVALAEAGTLAEAEDVVLLRYDELRAVVGHARSLDARAVVHERREERVRAGRLSAPRWLGTASERTLAFPYVSLWGMPELLQPWEATRERLLGLPASPGTAEGPVRVVSAGDDLAAAAAGEVVVAPTLAASWAPFLAEAAAVVTEAGGAASAPAALARELGVPGVVGATSATTAFESGTRVRVDGDAGEVVRARQTPEG